MEQKDSPSQRRFDRKVGFAQKLHNEASGEPDLATGLTSSPRATFDVIAQARLTGRLEPGSLHFVLDNSYGEDEGRGQEGRAFTLNDEASNCLTKVEAKLDPVTPGMGLDNRGKSFMSTGLRSDAEFWSGTPLRHASDESSLDVGDLDNSIELSIETLNLPPLGKLMRQDSTESEAFASVETPTYSPGLEISASPPESPSLASTPGPSSFSHNTPYAAYRMAVRSVMMAWEDPAKSIVQRVQLADLLRVVFGVERPEHLEVMQWALHANGRATSELEARLRCVYDDFLEADAGREWKEAEESELRRLLDKQHSLPSFNAMLEIAVLEGKDLKPKKQKAMCMSATADTGHMAVVQLKMPGGKSSDAPLPARTRTVGGGKNPAWSSKGKPMLLKQPPASIKVTVAVSSSFEDRGNEMQILGANIPILSSVNIDMLTALGQQTVGFSELSLLDERGEPDKTYMLPALRTIGLTNKGKLGWGLSIGKPAASRNKQGLGEVKVVVRYLPEIRKSTGNPQGRPCSHKESSGAASSTSRTPNTSHASGGASTSNGEASALLPPVPPTGTSPVMDKSQLATPNQTAHDYRVLLSVLWRCWSAGVKLPQFDGGTFVIGNNPDSSDQPRTVASMGVQPFPDPTKRHTVRDKSMRLKAIENSAQLSKTEPLAAEKVTPLCLHCPGEPWQSILKATAKLQRVRSTWCSLLLVEHMIEGWTVEHGFLKKLLDVWTPVVETARDGKFTRHLHTGDFEKLRVVPGQLFDSTPPNLREAKLHIKCTKEIVHHCVRGIENYDTAFRSFCAPESFIADFTRSMQTLLALACLGIRYDTKVELLVEPLKIHIRRNVHRRMKQTLPMAHMDHKACIAALRRSIDQAIDRLEFDLDASAAFPRQLDLPLFTARLRYTLIADHMLRMFTGPGVLPYTTGVMDMQDRMQDLHNLMTDANISATPLEATTEDGRNYVDLLDINRVLGRSLLKWVRDIGLNMKDWAGNIVTADAENHWSPLSDSVYHSSSVVDLLRLFAEAVDKIKDRLPPLESQVALHSEVWEKLQVGIHYVLRHYVRVLEGLCMKELFILKHRREDEYEEALRAGDSGGVLDLMSNIAATMQPCITSDICAILTNIATIYDGMASIQDRLLDAICGHDPFTEPMADVSLEEDHISEMSFMADDEDTGAAAIEALKPSDEIIQQLHGENAHFFIQASDGQDQEVHQAHLHPGAIEDMAVQRRRTWQKYCTLNERVLSSALGNCNYALAEAFKMKLLLGIVRLLQAERKRAAILAKLVDEPANKGSWNFYAGSDSRKTGLGISREYAASIIKDIDCEEFMDAILDSEMIIMDKHMSAGGFKSGLLTAWCALVSSIEEIVLGISGLWGTVTWQDAQVLGNLDLIDLSVKPTNALEVQYNRILDQMGAAGRKQPDLVPLQKGEPSTSESLLMEASRQEAVSPYYVAFCNEVGMGVGMMHLLGLLRQRRGDADAAFLVKKVLKDAEEMPMQVFFGKWDEDLIGKWRCLHAQLKLAGCLCVTKNYVAFGAAGTDPTGAKDIQLLLDLTMVSRMDLTYERHTQILTFTMFDKTCHSFCNTTRVWPDRNAIYETVCKACKGTGSVLEANLKGEGGAEAPVSLALPAGEEIYHSMECDRLSGSGLWTYRGVLYVCHSFLMFDRPGNERIMVKYSEVTDLKLDRSSGRWLASNVLVIKTKRPALGTLMFSITDPEHVALCMTSIATQVANHNNYQGA